MFGQYPSELTSIPALPGICMRHIQAIHLRIPFSFSSLRDSAGDMFEQYLFESKPKLADSRTFEQNTRIVPLMTLFDSSSPTNIVAICSGIIPSTCNPSLRFQEHVLNVSRQYISEPLRFRSPRNISTIRSSSTTFNQALTLLSSVHLSISFEQIPLLTLPNLLSQEEPGEIFGQYTI